MSTVELWTDGACSGNPGKGGWCAYLRLSGTDHQKMLSSNKEFTTNNEMELTAVVKGLESLKYPVNVNIFTDSNYVINSATKWVHGWYNKGWKNSENKPVANIELWQKYLVMESFHRITFTKVVGHSGNELNELCDKVAKSEILKINI